jgi:OOP family OmpA-OmpF porin
MSGDLEHNLDLSKRRAAAVVQALVADHGISADRLTPRGVGPLAPVASNDSEEGRALNRRVELVKR